MNILKKDDIKFEKSPTGVLNCRLKDGAVHEHLHCVTLFPLTLPEQYISVIKEFEMEVEEVGVIISLDGFSTDQLELVRKAVDERYFVPEILDIKRLSTKQSKRGHGFDEWIITTDRGEKTMYLFNPRENMAVTNAGVIIITDIEKNRYKITNLEKLSQDARDIIEGIMM